MSTPAGGELPAVAGQAPVAGSGYGSGSGSGSEQVDAAVAALDAAAGLPPHEQIPAYEAAHRTLQDTLTSIDEG
ncbi:MAG TPA: hypothetical protein VFM54_22145 [Micromonosporaceae bacterium]|nr:hypothetical protein [Micromonosporaceae bacterium]